MPTIKHTFIVFISLFIVSTNSFADDSSDEKFTYNIGIGSYIHFNPNDDHTNRPIITTFELHKSNDWFYGISLFNNSFDQFSQYVYVGKTFKSERESLQNWHFKISGGLIYGYKDEYQDKIPLNGLGIAPGILPSVGYKRADSRWGVDLSLLGAAGLALTVNFDL